MPVDAVGFARKGWERALQSEAFLRTAWPDQVVWSIDADGGEREWIERVSPKGPAKLRKRVVEGIVDADAVIAAVGQWHWHKAWSGRSEWLLVLAADEAGTAGLVALVERDAAGAPIIGAPSTWDWRREAPFQHDLSQVLAPVGNATAEMLSQALAEARKRRRRTVRASA